MSPTHNRKKVIRRAQKHGESLRAAALRRIQIWVPDGTPRLTGAHAGYDRRAKARIAALPKKRSQIVTGSAARRPRRPS
jgi:Antitoxin MazE-like